MSDRSTVGVLFGGRSVEHEVSLASARCVVGGLERAGYRTLPIAVATDGRWLAPPRSRELLDSDAARVDAPAAEGAPRVAAEPGVGLVVLDEDGPAKLDVDVLFPLVHGRGGEDGRVQGLLDSAGIAYVGAGVLGSALAMDKIVTRRLLDAHRIPGVAWLATDDAGYRRDAAGFRAEVAEGLGFPVFVKPANGGSSVGVSKVATPDELDGALAGALRCDRRVLVERAVDAREIECAVVGGDPPEASVLGEIVPSKEFYDYEAKYGDSGSKLIVPAELEPGRAERLRAWSTSAFRALDLWGLARIDFLVERNGSAAYLNEVNTLPGFSSISMFPKLWGASGLPLPKLMERLVGLAVERQRQGRRMRTSLVED